MSLKTDLFISTISSTLAAANQTDRSGPLYLRLARTIETAITSTNFKPGDALPSERDIADISNVSRVTVRNAFQTLVELGVIVQRQGSGTFVATPPARYEQSLSQLTSFTEDMAKRNIKLKSQWLERGIHEATAEECEIMSLPAGSNVSRLARLRVANNLPLAIERASLAIDILPDPSLVDSSLYEMLDINGVRPVAATQKISALNLRGSEAQLLNVPYGSAALRIERRSSLASGRVVEFTRSLYRGDTYDFVVALEQTL